jgi:hypothetical protein
MYILRLFSWVHGSDVSICSPICFHVRPARAGSGDGLGDLAFAVGAVERGAAAEV